MSIYWLPYLGSTLMRAFIYISQLISHHDPRSRGLLHFSSSFAVSEARDSADGH